MFKLLVIAWIIAGLYFLVQGSRVINKPENKEEVKKYLKELSVELGMKEEDCVCIVYVAFFVLGFAGVAVLAYRRIKELTRGDKNDV